MKLDLQTTLRLKGLAIALMVMHHVVGFPFLMSFFHPGMLPVFPEAIERGIGSFGKVCLPIYLMLSGYGFAIKSRTDMGYYLDKIWRTYLAYWFYFAIFVSIGLVWFRDVPFFFETGFRYQANPLEILGDFTAWTHRFNDSWWFLRVYLLLTLLSSPILAWANRHLGSLVVASSALFAGSLGWFDPSHAPQDTWQGILLWQFPYVLGILFERIGRTSWRTFFGTPWGMVMAMGLLLSAAYSMKINPRMCWQIWLAPVFLVLAVPSTRLVGFKDILAFLGQYNLPIWLTHCFFCYYFWQKWMVLPRYSLLVFLLVLACSLLVGIVGEASRGALGRFFARLGKQS